MFKKSRYFLVGVFAIPVKKVDGRVAPLPLRMEEMLGEDNPNALQPVLEEETVEKKEGDEKRPSHRERMSCQVPNGKHLYFFANTTTVPSAPGVYDNG